MHSLYFIVVAIIKPHPVYDYACKIRVIAVKIGKIKTIFIVMQLKLSTRLLKL